MATSGSFNTTGYGGRYLTFSWEQVSQSIANNSTTISWTLEGAGNAQYSWYEAGNFYVEINGEEVYYSEDRIRLYNGTVVASGTFTIPHGVDGTKSFSAYAEAGIYYYAVNCNGSGSWLLPAIPRYATVDQTLTARTETTATIKWTSDKTVDYIWYSSDNGSNWTGVDVADGTSGSYTISGLTANTAYQCKTRVRAKDSQLTTDSSALEVTTYAYPYANSMPNFTIGAKLTVGIFNPLGRSVTVELIAVNNSVVGSISTSGTSVSGFDGTSAQNALYASIPSATGATYKVKVTYGTQATTTSGGTYSINRSVCLPSISTASYQDINSTTTAITGNNQQIVRNMSVVMYMASGLSAQKSASVISCSVTVNGNVYALTVSGSSASGGNAVIDSGTNVVATFTVTDSRGLTASKAVEITMLDYYLPSAIITLLRQSNFYSATDITVDARYAYVDGKNSITITYKARKTGTSTWTVTGTLSDNVQSTFTADNTYEWDVQVVLVDAFGGTVTYNTSLAKGMPLIFFDRLLLSVGIGCFPQDQESLEVLGVNVLNAIFFKGGDTLTIDGGIINGLITGSLKTIKLNIPVRKSLANISSISVTACKGGIRTSDGGFVNSGSDSTNWKTASGVTVSAAKVTDYMISLTISSSAAFSNVTNNTPVAMLCSPVTLSLSA